MLVMILVGWVVVLPLLVVVGLSLASRILGSRARARGGAIDVTGLFGDLAALAEVTACADAAPPASRRPVGSRH